MIRREMKLVEQAMDEFDLVRRMNKAALELNKREAAMLLEKEILDIAQSKIESKPKRR